MFKNTALPEPDNPRRFVMVEPAQHGYGHDSIVEHYDAVAELSDRSQYEATLGKTAAEFLGYSTYTEDPEDALYARTQRVAEQTAGQLRVMKKRHSEEYARTLEVTGLEDKDTLSPQEMRLFLESRQQELIEAQAEFGEQLEVWREEVRIGLRWAADHGLDMDLERAETRLDQLRLRLLDSAVYSSNGGQIESATMGRYSPESDEIFVSVERLRQSLASARRNFFHEAMHGIAGTRLKLWTKSEELERSDQGFYHKSYDVWGARTDSHMSWLEEATVEQFSLLLAHHEQIEEVWDSLGRGPLDLGALPPRIFRLLTQEYETTHYYGYERHFVFNFALQQIPIQERPIQMLWNAFTEDYRGSEHEPGQRNPAHKRLFHTLHTTVNMAKADAEYTNTEVLGLQRYMTNVQLDREFGEPSHAELVTSAREARTEDRQRTLENIERYKNPKWHHKVAKAFRRKNPKNR